MVEAMLPDDWKLPYPLPLLPSEIKAKEEAEAKAARRAEKVARVKAAKPTPLKVIKAEVLALFGLQSTADLKKILVAKGVKLNLSRRDSWEPLLDPSNGTRWLIEQHLKRQQGAATREIDLERIAAKKAQISLDFKYRSYSTEELQEMNRQAAEFIRQKQQELVA